MEVRRYKLFLLWSIVGVLFLQACATAGLNMPSGIKLMAHHFIKEILSTFWRAPIGIALSVFTKYGNPVIKFAWN